MRSDWPRITSYLAIIIPREVIIIWPPRDSLMFLIEEETNKMKENAISLILTQAIILKQSFSSGSVNIVN